MSSHVAMASSSRALFLLLVACAVSVSTASSICNNEPNELVPDGCSTYGTLDGLNAKIQPMVREITQGTDFFSYYRLDLYGRTCPFWSDDSGMCANIACAVNTIDNEEDIPPIWRAEELSKLAGPKASHPKGEQARQPSPLSGALGEDTEESCVVESDECDERDYCIPEDESASSNGNYVSLIENPERFTGYAGAGAENVWKAIYRENCFLKPREDSAHQSSASTPFGYNAAAQGFLNVLQEKAKHGVAKDASGKPALATIEVDDECLEKRVFYRLISGMHSSISMHLCWDYLNQTTGNWKPNLDCFINRFQGHPERLQNIYFNYALLLRAVSKLRNYIQTYTFCSGDPQQNRLTKAKVIKLVDSIPSGTRVFDEGVMFQDDMAALKEDFRNRFRNVSRVMDCVGCDKCRLWGKVQTQGYGTALKILFEFDESVSLSQSPPLRRTELVALVNTLDRISHSLQALQGFQKLWEARNRTEAIAAAPSSDSSHREELRRIRSQTSIKAQIAAEWELIWDTFFVVLRSWQQMPRFLIHASAELASWLWDRALGRPHQEPYYDSGHNEPRSEL